MAEYARYKQPEDSPRRAPKGAGACHFLPNKHALLSLVRQSFEMLPGAACIRIELPVSLLDARAWLRDQTAPTKIYWRDREGVWETAGVGVADVVTDAAGIDNPDFAQVYARLRQTLSCAHPEMRYYGGWAFDGTSGDTSWRGFGAYRFILPRFELMVKGCRATFACNVRRSASLGSELASISDEFDQLVFRENPAGVTLPAFVAREDLPPRHQWERLVSAALQAVSGGALEKVVLARQVRLHYASALDASAIVELLGAGAKTNTYLFAIQPAEGRAFVGATPERLYKTLGGYLKSEALAGTRPRGDSAAADINLGHDLMHSQKELHEHGLVSERLRGVMARLCKDVKMDQDLSVIRLRRCQHLVRRFEGILSNGYTDASVLADLHPTPAVGGHPDGPALQWLRENEPFERGWYAGPVGWVGYDSSEFAIAIRSGLINGNMLTLYSGAGIVAGSTPSQEWEETESKLAAFLDVLSPHDKQP